MGKTLNDRLSALSALDDWRLLGNSWFGGSNGLGSSEGDLEGHRSAGQHGTRRSISLEGEFVSHMELLVGGSALKLEAKAIFTGSGNLGESRRNGELVRDLGFAGVWLNRPLGVSHGLLSRSQLPGEGLGSDLGDSGRVASSLDDDVEGKLGVESG